MLAHDVARGRAGASPRSVRVARAAPRARSASSSGSKPARTSPPPDARTSSSGPAARASRARARRQASASATTIPNPSCSEGSTKSDAPPQRVGDRRRRRRPPRRPAGSGAAGAAADEREPRLGQARPRTRANASSSRRDVLARVVARGRRRRASGARARRPVVVGPGRKTSVSTGIGQDRGSVAGGEPGGRGERARERRARRIETRRADASTRPLEPPQQRRVRPRARGAARAASAGAARAPLVVEATCRSSSVGPAGADRRVAVRRRGGARPNERSRRAGETAPRDQLVGATPARSDAARARPASAAPRSRLDVEERRLVRPSSLGAAPERLRLRAGAAAEARVLRDRPRDQVTATCS